MNEPIMNEPGAFHSPWPDTVGQPRRHRAALEGNIDTDVVIVGAGITGLSAAWYLINSGKRVAIVEAGDVGGGTTGSSTGNLYIPVGPRLHEIEKKHGDDVVRATVAAREAAINFIGARVHEKQFDCDFRRVPFHLFSAPDTQGAEDVQKEFATLQKIGVPVSNALTDSFPFEAAALATLPNQAQFNPLQYTIGLAEALELKGCTIFENSRVLETEDGDVCTVVTASGKVTARHIVKATHVPQGFYAIHAAMIPHREYAVLARVTGEIPPPGIYWNASRAWHYSVRPWRSPKGNYIMVIGESHKPGEQRAEQLTSITQFLHAHFSVAEIAYIWAAQNYQSADLLPFIGTSPLEKNTWMATGFAVDGLVWGTFAGKLICDGINEVKNPLAPLFDPKRFTPIASARNVLKESAAVSKHLLNDFLFYGRAKECNELAPGAGQVINVEGEKIAACRDLEGHLHMVSAVCTHMGCLVHWNAQELSWDCPCHGSRFAMDGRVLEGPAQKDLMKPRSDPES